MSKKSPEVDAYIAEARGYARPILERIRALFHKGCPELEEEIKWGVPHFNYKGMFGGMSAFKKHVTLGFWKGTLLVKSRKLLDAHGEQMGKTTMTRINVAEVGDLPSDKVLLAVIQEAKELNDAGVKMPTRPKKKAEPIEAPDDFLAALKKNAAAKTNFEKLRPSHRNEYVKWISEAKRTETRAKRIASAIEMIAQGKSKDWKYENC